jgi:hypothetical protein
MELTTRIPGSYSVTVISGSVVSNALTLVAREARDYQVSTLPVVFHVVHLGEAIGVLPNLSTAHINDLLRILNATFSNQLGSKDPNAVDSRVRFRLAVKDMADAMMLEPGIRRIDGSPFDVGGGAAGFDVAGDRRFGPNEAEALMSATYWDPRQYINVWIMPLRINGGGAAELPRMYINAPLPGLETVPIGCCEPYKLFFYSMMVDTANREHAIVHEMGHRLGLLHPFAYGKCGPGDYASDTFDYLTDVAGFPACPGNSGLLTFTTIMDYRGALNTLTYDQRERIQAVLENGLWIKEVRTSQK